MPAGATLSVDGHEREVDGIDLAPGRRIELAMGSFVVRIARVAGERLQPRAPLEELRGSGAGFIAGSALFHAAVFAAVALFAPSLGATEEDPFDADRMALLQRMLDASAQREMEHPPREDAALAGGEGRRRSARARGRGRVRKTRHEPERSRCRARHRAARGRDARA